MRRRHRWSAWVVRYSLFAFPLVGLTLGPRALCPARQVGTTAAGPAGLAQTVAGGRGWQVHVDPLRPRGVVFLVDPKRRQPSPALSSLRTTGPEWEGVVRLEAVATAAGRVDAEGGIVWRGLWFYGDRGMLDDILPQLR